MTQPGGRQWSHMWAAMSSALVSAVPAEVRAEQHLATEAIVAFVDGELGLAAHERAARHLAQCTSCTAEVAAQRQARAAVRDAGAPVIPQSLLAALHTIPQRAELPPGPDELAMTEDGQLVVVQRPTQPAQGLGSSTPLGGGDRLGSSTRLGATGFGSDGPSGGTGAGSGGSTGGGRRRRARQGAGFVVSGLVLGALVLTTPVESVSSVPGSPYPGAGGAGTAPVSPLVARLDLQRQGPAVAPAMLAR